MFRPVATALMIVAKLSSVRIMRGGILADLGTGDAHRDADIRLLQRRRIIDTVSGHRDQFALTLPCFDDADLMLRCDTRIDAHLFQACASSSSSLIALSSMPSRH